MIPLNQIPYLDQAAIHRIEESVRAQNYIKENDPNYKDVFGKTNAERWRERDERITQVKQDREKWCPYDKCVNESWFGRGCSKLKPSGNRPYYLSNPKTDYYRNCVAEIRQRRKKKRTPRSVNKRRKNSVRKSRTKRRIR